MADTAQGACLLASGTKLLAEYEEIIERAAANLRHAIDKHPKKQ
jgi:hypothetical protein